MNHNRRLLLVGMGSVGTSHLSKASRVFKNITVLDVDESKALKVQEFGESLGIETSYVKSADFLFDGPEFDLVVLANWGPDHASTYRELSKLSNNFLIEKPLTSKIGDLLFLREEVSAGKIIVTNLQRNYSGFKEKVSDLQGTFDLGDLCGVQLFGGAKCLVTIGIHYLSLTSKLLGQYPTSVMAITNSMNINPRRKDFLYFDGVSVWEYGGGKFLSMHLQNNSHIGETFRVIFENGLIEVGNGLASVLAIPFEDRRFLERPTKTLYPSQPLVSFEAFTISSEQDGLDAIYQGFEEHAHKPEDFEPGYQATLGTIASLLSSERKTSINIQDLESIDSQLILKDWNIT
jgi:predicted dehydrogenase